MMMTVHFILKAKHQSMYALWRVVYNALQDLQREHVCTSQNLNGSIRWLCIGLGT